LEFYKKLHPEALLTRNGVRIVKPSWKIAMEEKDRLEYLMKKMKLEE